MPTSAEVNTAAENFIADTETADAKINGSAGSITDRHGTTTKNLEQILSEIPGAVIGAAGWRDFPDVLGVLADSSLTYTPLQAETVTPGDVITTRTENFSYVVAASGATDHHVSTAGGVKLYAQPAVGGSVSVDALGAVGDGVTDDSAAIQIGVDNFPTVMFGAKTYGIGAPIQFGGLTTLVGVASGESAGRGKTKLKKLDTSVGTGSNTSPSTGAVTDSYAVNAVLIATHSDSGFNYACRIRDLTVEGRDTYDTSIGIYAPRISQWYVENVDINKCETGWKTFDGWLCTLQRVTVDCFTVGSLIAGERGIGTQGFATTTRGFHWAKDGGGGATGTSLSMIGCWARRAHIGYDINNLNYSALHSCAADNMESSAYNFETCNNMVMNGCGMEQIMCTPGLDFASGTYVVTGLRAMTGIYGVSGNALYRASSGAKVTFIGTNAGDFASVNSALNRIVQNGSHVTEIDTQMPSNGNTYVSYSSGSTLTVLTEGALQFKNASGVSNMKEKGSAPGGQLFRSDKAIASAGTDILTITAGGAGNRDVVSGKIKMFYTDQSFVNGAGYIEAAFVCYRETTNYYEAVDQSGLDVKAGNTYTTSPTFSITESGGVWTVAVTPAHGGTNAEMIDVEWHEALNSDVTVAFA